MVGVIGGGCVGCVGRSSILHRKVRVGRRAGVKDVGCGERMAEGNHAGGE